MIHAAAISESIVAPTFLRLEFSHSLGQKRKFSVGLGMSEVGGKADLNFERLDVCL